MKDKIIKFFEIRIAPDATMNLLDIIIPLVLVGAIFLGAYLFEPEIFDNKSKSYDLGSASYYWDLPVLCLYEYDPAKKTSISNFDKIYFTINGKKYVATKIKE